MPPARAAHARVARVNRPVVIVHEDRMEGKRRLQKKRGYPAWQVSYVQRYIYWVKTGGIYAPGSMSSLPSTTMAPAGHTGMQARHP